MLGVWIDRVPSAAPLTLSLMVFAVGLVAIGVSLHNDVGAVATLVALVAGLFAPAVAGGWSASLTSGDPVRGRRLVLFDASSYSIAGLVGPLLAALAYAVAGRSAPLVVTVALLLAGSACSPWTRTASTVRASGLRAEAPVTHPWIDLRRGFALIIHRPRLRWATSSSVIAFFGFGVFFAIVPTIGATQFGTPAGAGIILGVMAGCALVSNAILSRRGELKRPSTVLALGTVTVGVGLILMLIPSPAAALVAAAIIGTGDGPLLAALLHIRHLEAPARLRTQVFTTGASLKITASGLGALAAIPLMIGGLSLPLLVAAGVHLIAAALAGLATDPLSGHGATAAK